MFYKFPSGNCLKIARSRKMLYYIFRSYRSKTFWSSLNFVKIFCYEQSCTRINLLNLQGNLDIFRPETNEIWNYNFPTIDFLDQFYQFFHIFVIYINFTPNTEYSQLSCRYTKSNLNIKMYISKFFPIRFL